MRKFLLLTGIVLFCSVVSHSQETSNKSGKIYETWVRLNNSSLPISGVLYEIRDSSIVISNSKLKSDVIAGKYLAPQINYRDINYIMARKPNSITKGAVIGATLGFFIPLFALTEKNSGIPTGTTLILLSIPLGTLSGTFGGFLGYLKRYVPVNGSYDQFSGNETRLKKYSYLKEESDGLNINELNYEHKTYIALSSGISIPFGDFADRSPDNANGDSAMMGGGVNFSAGYRFNNNFGLSASLFNGQYNVFKNEDDFWLMTSLSGGPVFSTRVVKKLYLELKPAIGFSSLTFEELPDHSTSYQGLLFNLSASSTFNFSRRWCLITEAGYLSTNQKMYDNKLIKIRAANIWLGIGYRFR